ncbi:MAG: rod shape-determining protein MreD [Actinomycetota bacterium]|nr:rod shape-determining protein MreD [Actinomycetota bacterium]
MAGSVVHDQLVRVRRVAPLGAVFLSGLMLQAAVAPHLGVGGSAPDLLLVAVAAVAVGRGPRAGAGFGFAAGLGADLFLATPLGTSALAYTLVGHVLGDRCRPGSSGTAAALCSPASTCFACRTGRRHPMLVNTVDGDRPVSAPEPARVRRRAVRRGAVRRSIGLTGLAVGGGRLATVVVATAMGGLPFPGALGLLRIVGVAAGSALLGPVAFAAVRRLPGAPVGRAPHTGRRPW